MLCVTILQNLRSASKGSHLHLQKYYTSTKFLLVQDLHITGVSLKYFRLIQVKPFARWLIFITKWIWQNYVVVFVHIFNFPASPKEQLVHCEKVLKEHSSNLSSFIFMYCTAPGSNPPVVVWCYLSPPWHPQLLPASGKEDKWLLCSGATPGPLCLHLVSIVVLYLGASSVWITLVYFEPFLLHFPTLPSPSLIFCLDTWA